MGGGQSGTSLGQGTGRALGSKVWAARQAGAAAGQQCSKSEHPGGLGPLSQATPTPSSLAWAWCWP